MKKYTQSKQLKTSLGQEWIQGSNHLDCSYIITDITGVVNYFFKINVPLKVSTTRSLRGNEGV